MKKLHLKQFIKEEILNVLKESVNEFGPLAGSGNKDNLELMKRKASKKSESGEYVYVVGGSGGTYKLSKYEDEGNTHAAYYNGIQQDIQIVKGKIEND